MGLCVWITVLKGWSRVGTRTGTLMNPTKCLWRWEPDRRSNFFFNPPAHLCAVTYMTEISLIVTLSNQYTFTLFKKCIFRKNSAAGRIFLLKKKNCLYYAKPVFYIGVSVPWSAFQTDHYSTPQGEEIHKMLNCVHYFSWHIVVWFLRINVDIIHHRTFNKSP